MAAIAEKHPCPIYRRYEVSINQTRLQHIVLTVDTEAAQSDGSSGEANDRGFGSAQKLCVGFALLLQKNTSNSWD